MSTSQPSTEPRVRLLRERTEPTELSQPSNAPKLIESRAHQPEMLEEPSSKPLSGEYLTKMTEIIAAIAKVAAARVLLMAALLGSFVLSFQAMLNPTSMSLATVMSFDVLVLIPLAALAWQKG